MKWKELLQALSQELQVLVQIQVAYHRHALVKETLLSSSLIVNISMLPKNIDDMKKNFLHVCSG
jgi:hypothetical protein